MKKSCHEIFKTNFKNLEINHKMEQGDCLKDIFTEII